MKKILCLLLVAVILFNGCRKDSEISTDVLYQSLQSKMDRADFLQLDFQQKTLFKSPSTGKAMVRIGFKDKEILSDFALVSLTDEGIFESGKIVHINGAISVSAKGKNLYNGTISVYAIDRKDSIISGIRDGYIVASHQYNAVLANSEVGIRSNSVCSDCTLPEVIVSSSPKSAGFSDPFAWLSLFWLDDSWPKSEYIPIGGGGGGGGGQGDAPPVIAVDEEDPEKKEKVDSKKYMDCFGTIPDGGVTTYSVTISADIPVDGHPEIFFDWSDRSPGHAFITLSKSSPYGGITQSIGFYPISAFKLATLSNGGIPSKIVDNGQHEYQASFTITVTANQFQAAIDRVNQNSSRLYSVGIYNCTDFALDVFNAAGGNFTIPRHTIPAFETDGGSNTPQGLYEKITQLKNSGKAGAATSNNKLYTGRSHGPCE